jgi:hypothetical protein
MSETRLYENPPYVHGKRTQKALSLAKPDGSAELKTPYDSPSKQILSFSAFSAASNEVGERIESFQGNEQEET